MDLNVLWLPDSYRKALEWIKDERKKEEILSVLLDNNLDDDLKTKETVDKKFFHNYIELSNKLKVVDKHNWDYTIYKFYKDWDYVAFAEIWFASQTNSKTAYIEWFVTSNYQTTDDSDLPIQLKEEFYKMENLYVPWLWTSVIIKLIKSLFKKDITTIRLISSKWANDFYNKVFNMLENDWVLEYYIEQDPGEEFKKFIIDLKNCDLLDML